eukprot:TRINITY_DN121581_c0_g1_i1.p1 TRINITY_DN121581_c0_g1~~TRINITY_DN121581_c0_g1_i1.p1  ORF type:complete len:1336 (+),score=353.32 TRINITY_DN121581_c0_g1_i1:112-4119(+)
MSFNPPGRAGYTSSITVFVNGERHTLTNVHPHKTLQDWLHELGFTGTKVSCAQGACGACTVALAEHKEGQTRMRAVNACLRPLLLCDGCAVTTTEGIGCASKPHPCQERIATMNGSQCGYCTPGHVMSMYSLLQENPHPSAREVESRLEGNICRCTGYRAIHAAFHTFADKHATTDVPGYPKEFTACSTTAKFPDELVGYTHKPLLVQSEDGSSKWFRPSDLNQVAEIAKECGLRKPRMVVGNTSVGVFGHKVGAITTIDVSSISELQGVKTNGSGITVGGAESLRRLIDALRTGNDAQQTLAGAMSKIANHNIRNAGGWAGNLVMGRVLYFPSDGAVLLNAYGAEVTLAIMQDGSVTRKTMPVGAFIEDTELNNYTYVLLSITLPSTTARFNAYRQGISKSNCHAYANAAFCSDLSSGGVFKSPRIVFGCIGKRAIVAEEAMSYLEGKQATEETLQGLLDILQKIAVEKDNTYVTGQNPEGKTEAKKTTILGFAFKWFVSVMESMPEKLQSLAWKGPGYWENRDPAMSVPQTLNSKGQLNLPEGHPGSTYVGPKKESVEQACGQTKYAGDVQMGPRGVYGVYVTAPKVGKLTNIDTEAALKQEGVVAWIGADDVPGMNSSSLIPGEEPLFAEVDKDIIFAGQIVGVIVANTHQQAKSAAPVVKLTIQEPSAAPVFTIEEAAEKKSFLYGPDFPGKKLETGDVDKVFSDSSLVVVEGKINVAGQNNFYMEKHTCVAQLDDMGRIVIYGGAQTPDMTKSHVMVALGCKSRDLVLKMRPMGGAYGGKFTRQFSTFCSSAVACKKLQRPVRIAMNLLQDMGCAGNTRHIVNCHYKVAATKEGKIVAIDNKMLIDAGCSNDYTDYMAHEILDRQDLAYDISNYRGVLNMVKTNNPTASAVRAPGLAQAAAITETMVDSVARACNVSQEEVRLLSLKPKDTAKDQTGQKMNKDWNGHELWAKAKSDFKFEERQKACDEFNKQNKFTKRAIALMPMKYAIGYTNMSGIHVTVNISASDGCVEIQTGGAEMGQGVLTKVMSCAATELGVPFEKVSAFPADTSVLPNQQTDGGSAGSELLCQATKKACDKLKERLAETKEVLLAEKKAAGGDSDATASFEEVCGRAFGPMPTDSRVLLSATEVATVPYYNDLKRTPQHPPLGAPWWHMNPLPEDIWQYYVTGIVASEVELDVLSGSYTILRSDLIVDAGNSLNPLIDLGQVEGGFVYGLGMYCQEEPLMDPQTGVNKGEGTWNYKPPNNKDVPQIFNVELLKGNESSRTLYGSKGIGEAPLVLAYSVVSAVKKAVLASRLERGLDKDFRIDSPATPDRVLKALAVRPSDMSLK